MWSRACTIITVLACSAGAAHARTLRMGAPGSRIGVTFATVGLVSVSPGTISFTASNPDGGPVSGSAPATVSWQVSGGSHLQTWSLSLQAAASTLANCPTIPVSAIQVRCSTASVSGGGGSGTCGGSLPLSTTLQQAAGGSQGDNSNSYTVYLTFTLNESWHYTANSSCTLTITYSITAQ
jgi:hypothetical protein